MKIEWNKVTWYSWVLAIVVFVGTFCIGIWLGMQIATRPAGMGPRGNPGIGMGTGANGQASTTDADKIIATVTYSCEAGKQIQAIYKQGKVEISTNDGTDLTLPQTMSADGGRYANTDESFIFWSKGNGAFVMQTVSGVSTTTYSNCTQVPAPVSP